MSENSNSNTTRLKKAETQLYKAKYIRMSDNVIRQLETHMNELIDMDETNKSKNETHQTGVVMETDPDMAGVEFIPLIDNFGKS